jgi:hypothetical protein
MAESESTSSQIPGGISSLPMVALTEAKAIPPAETSPIVPVQNDVDQSPKTRSDPGKSTEKEIASLPPLKFITLFRFADTTDYILMGVGLIGAIGYGTIPSR